MQQLNTKYNLENNLACAIAEWFETGHVPLYKYPEKFHEAIWIQGAIGLGQIFNGRISRHWFRKSKDGLYLGSIDRRDLFMNND